MSPAVQSPASSLLLGRAPGHEIGEGAIVGARVDQFVAKPRVFPRRWPDSDARRGFPFHRQVSCPRIDLPLRSVLERHVPARIADGAYDVAAAERRIGLFR